LKQRGRCALLHLLKILRGKNEKLTPLHSSVSFKNKNSFPKFKNKIQTFTVNAIFLVVKVSTVTQQLIRKFKKNAIKQVFSSEKMPNCFLTSYSFLTTPI